MKKRPRLNWVIAIVVLLFVLAGTFFLLDRLWINPNLKRSASLANANQQLKVVGSAIQLLDTREYELAYQEEIEKNLYPVANFASKWVTDWYWPPFLSQLRGDESPVRSMSAQLIANWLKVRDRIPEIRPFNIQSDEVLTQIAQLSQAMVVYQEMLASEGKLSVGYKNLSASLIDQVSILSALSEETRLQGLSPIRKTAINNQVQSILSSTQALDLEARKFRKLIKNKDLDKLLANVAKETKEVDQAMKQIDKIASLGVNVGEEWRAFKHSHQLLANYLQSQLNKHQQLKHVQRWGMRVFGVLLIVLVGFTLYLVGLIIHQLQSNVNHNSQDSKYTEMPKDPSPLPLGLPPESLEIDAEQPVQGAVCEAPVFQSLTTDGQPESVFAQDVNPVSSVVGMSSQLQMDSQSSIDLSVSSISSTLNVSETSPIVLSGDSSHVSDSSVVSKVDDMNQFETQSVVQPPQTNKEPFAKTLTLATANWIKPESYIQEQMVRAWRSSVGKMIHIQEDIGGQVGEALFYIAKGQERLSQLNAYNEQLRLLTEKIDIVGLNLNLLREAEDNVYQRVAVLGDELQLLIQQLITLSHLSKQSQSELTASQTKAHQALAETQQLMMKTRVGAQDLFEAMSARSTTHSG